MKQIDILLFVCVLQYVIVGCFIGWLVIRQKKMKRAVSEQQATDEPPARYEDVEYAERPYIEIY